MIIVLLLLLVSPALNAGFLKKMVMAQQAIISPVDQPEGLNLFECVSGLSEDTLAMTQALNENFFIVEDRRLYRSAQLSPQALSKYIKKYGIKTVINLRGYNPGEKWWDDEKKVCDKLGVKLHNISMSACILTSKKNLIKLLELYDTVEVPILIHCRAGADRTGEAAAIWCLEKQGQSKQKAGNQLSVLYRHFRLKYPAKIFLINIWGGRQWLKSIYKPSDYPQFIKT